jgi:acetyltransferase-like isoleucine patch superfamily enzyme
LNLSNKYYNFTSFLLKLLYTPICRFKAKIFGITLGNRCNFWGNIIFYKKKKSLIIVGNNCSFRSRASSNLIGINRPCIIATHASGADIHIGNNCGFSGTVLGAFKSIKLGNNVRCGANTLITDSDWHLDDLRAGAPQEVIIEDNVWLGTNVIVLKGVKIGANSVIGAGSIVTKNIPENVIAAGNPCNVIKVICSEKK